MQYIHQLKAWPNFTWDKVMVLESLVQVRNRQGFLLGKMEGLGFSLKSEANLNTLISDVTKSSEIEGEFLDKDQVRSSIARRLGLDIAGLIPSDRNVDGVVEMMLDATQNRDKALTSQRLFEWHASLFPTGKSGLFSIVVGQWRDNAPDDPMQVVSGPLGREKVHFEAPASDLLEVEMNSLLQWINNVHDLDSVLKAAIAHLWFVTIHPFDDGNGRIARAITDMLLARADGSNQRFYSMSSEIRNQRKAYYKVLEETQKSNLDITEWLLWFLTCLENALEATSETLSSTVQKAKFWERHASTPFNDRQALMVNKLFDGFIGKLTSSKWAKMCKCSQDTAGRDINDLLKKEVLVKTEGGGRSTSYLLNF
ncbi:Fic family protein [Roseivirga echinicomitans]|uniref:Cell filamentation protein Fic n=1 Tax=Roseivirga echinicomitans TaxID=296218 RepID=A0A150XDG6_9BACT|nr:Fic family protein [Roseivirga echinicomitans]KYG76767.1 cell filamentation protein Fic [Roseivirga echinicomitans]